MRIRIAGQLRVALGLCLALLFFSPESQATSCPLGAPLTCLTGQGDWTGTLQERSFDGGLTIGGYYDTALKITWLADANLAKTSLFDADGNMHFSAANDWANGLIVNGSISGWRLPTMIDTGSAGCNPSLAGGTDCGWNVQTAPGAIPPAGNLSELAHMFYVTLGNAGAYDTSGVSQPPSIYGLKNSGPFANLFASFYWTNLPDAGPETCLPDGPCAWYFDFTDGSQYFDSTADSYHLFAWAVHDGDAGVAPVPLPASAWLLLSGLLSLVIVGRKRAPPMNQAQLAS